MALNPLVILKGTREFELPDRTFQERIVRLLGDLTGDVEHIVSGPLGFRLHQIGVYS